MNTPTLKVRGLFAGYLAIPVLTNIDFELALGEWLSLLGPNGSGKTTLLRTLSGQLHPTAGAIEIGGQSLQRAPRAAKRLLGYAHAPELLPSLLTGRQCLEVYAAAHDLLKIDDAVLQLSQRLALANALDRAVASYSLGMRQKLCALLALSGAPRLILLDESFNGLDPASALVLKRELQRRVATAECSVILATHALDIAVNYSTRVALLLDGTIVRTWNSEDLASLRAGGSCALEQALADAAQSGTLAAT
jgi:ABC-2 type transport system ATP-binding protein